MHPVRLKIIQDEEIVEDLRSAQLTSKRPKAEFGAKGAKSDERMLVGDLAARSGKTVRAIHLYEELSLLHPLERTKGGYRVYGTDALLRIRLLSTLQDLGMSLPEIQRVLGDWEHERKAHASTRKMRLFYGEKLAETTAQMHKLQHLMRELQASVAYLEHCGDVCEPEREVESCGQCELNSFSCHTKPVPPSSVDDARRTRALAPDLVRGFRASKRTPLGA
jgi:MerR family transcriptional regulator, copper efflux regulator